MSVGPHPGETYRLKVTSNNGSSTTLKGDGIVAIISGGMNDVAYFKMGKDYVVHFRPADDGQPDGDNQEPSAS